MILLRVLWTGRVPRLGLAPLLDPPLPQLPGEEQLPEVRHITQT